MSSNNQFNCHNEHSRSGASLAKERNLYMNNAKRTIKIDKFDNIEQYGDVLDAMLMQGVHSEIAVNEEIVEASAEYIYGDEDDEEETQLLKYLT